MSWSSRLSRLKRRLIDSPCKTVNEVGCQFAICRKSWTRSGWSQTQNKIKTTCLFVAGIKLDGSFFWIKINGRQRVGDGKKTDRWSFLPLLQPWPGCMAVRAGCRGRAVKIFALPSNCHLNERVSNEIPLPVQWVYIASCLKIGGCIEFYCRKRIAVVEIRIEPLLPIWMKVAESVGKWIL